MKRRRKYDERYPASGGVKEGKTPANVALKIQKERKGKGDRAYQNAKSKKGGGS